MNANEVIETYISDVAERLPRRQRNDVAFELRALLVEELQARAEASGRSVDAAMATDFLQGFGRPEDIAARYRPTLTIIDPADGHAFLRATVIGMAVIWCAGLLRLWEQFEAGGNLLNLTSQWLVGVVVGSLWWPGVLVAGYGMAASARRRRSQPAAWQPKPRDRLMGGRTTQVLGILGIVIGVTLLINPTWILDFFWNGRAAPAAYQALTYSETFLQRQAPLLLALLILNIPMLLVAIALGRRTKTMQRIETGLSLATCALMLWTALDGPVLMAPASDSFARTAIALIAAWILLDFAYRAYQRVTPAPAARDRADSLLS